MFSKLVSSGSKLWTEGVKNLVIRDKVIPLFADTNKPMSTVLIEFSESTSDENNRFTNGEQNEYGL